MNPNTVYAALKRLEKAGILKIESNNKYSLVTICNWAKYQGKNSDFDNTSKTGVKKAPDNNTITTGQQQDNNKITLNNNEEVISNNTVPIEDAHLVIDYYNEVFFKDKPKTHWLKHPPGRLDKIRTRLKSFSLDEIKQAIDNAHSHDWFMGSGGWFGDIDFLVKNDINLEKYLRLSYNAKPKEPIF